MKDLFVKSSRVLTESGIAPATLHVRGDKILAILPRDHASPASETDDYGSHLIMPGLVDTHAHINEPGRTEWEGFATATRAAAAGGITTVIDMPLNSIPATTSLAALRTKQASARDACLIDYGFWGGVVPGNTEELEPMIEAGVAGFKCFLCPSGVDEFMHVMKLDLELAMPILAKRKIPLIVHAELESPLHNRPSDPRSYSTYLASRPAKWEVDAIRMMISLAESTGCRTHIVHLSASDALADLSAARSRGVPISAETCPHYLALESEQIESGATQFKCAPPIRDHRNREALWSAIREGQIEFIVSDHSPCTPALKVRESGDFTKAWGGIAGLQFSMPVVWTEMRARGMTVSDLSRLMSANTAKFAGIDECKGAIRIGAHADFVAWDPDASYTLTEAMTEHKHKLTPYSGRTLFGRIHGTYVRGALVYLDGKFPNPPRGRFIARKEHK